MKVLRCVKMDIKRILQFNKRLKKILKEEKAEIDYLQLSENYGIRRLLKITEFEHELYEEE
jgi:hypothetical protein